MNRKDRKKRPEGVDEAMQDFDDCIQKFDEVMQDFDDCIQKLEETMQDFDDCFQGVNEVLKNLDSCVQEINKAEKTGDWAAADARVKTLSKQSKDALRVAEFNFIVNVLAAISGFGSGDFLNVMLAMGGICQAAILIRQLLASKREE